MSPLVRSVGLRRGGAFAPPVVEYADDFEGHPLGTGVPAGWAVGDGNATPTWEVTGVNPLEGAKSLRSSGGGTGERSLVFSGSMIRNGTVSALLRPVSAIGSNNAQPSLLGRYVDGDNYVHARISSYAVEQGLTLVQKVGGSTTILKRTPYAVTLGTTYRAKLVMDSGVLWALLYDTGGNLLALTRAATTVTAAGAVGVRHIGVSATIMYDLFSASPRIETPSLLDRSLEFNGTNQYGRLEDEAAFDIATNLTIEADCYPDSTTGNRTIVARFEGSDHAYVLRVEEGKLCLYCHIGGSWRSAMGATTIPTGQWSHLAGVYDGSTLKVYVNGVEDGSTAQTGSIPNRTAPLYIGRSSAGEYWDGKLTNVRLWSVNRSGSLGATIDGSEAGLVFAYEAQNAGAGPVWLDKSTNLRDMPLFNAPAWSADVP